MKLSRVSHVSVRPPSSFCAPVLAALIAGLAVLPVRAAINIAVSPTNIVWNTNTWVGLTVTGITANAGVDIRLYVDVNRNRSVDTNDVCLTEFRVQDGVTNAWGASAIAGDTNTTAARIGARVPYFGLLNEAVLWHAAGDYLWEAQVTNGSEKAAAAFRVTQPTSTVWIAGTVGVVTNDAFTAGRLLPGALVMVDYYSLLDGEPPAVWTDTNGAFKVYLPAGASPCNVYGVTAVGAGYLMAPSGPYGDPLSSYRFTELLSAGANPLPSPLLVVPPVPGMVYTISGRITDDGGRPVRAGLVQTDMDDSDLFAVAFTDTNGNYRIPMPEQEQSLSVRCADPLVNLRGLVGAGTQIVSVVTNITGVDLKLRRATGLIRGTVTKYEGGGGVAGVQVNVNNGRNGSVGYTFGTSGTFELGSIGGSNYEASVDDWTLRPMRRFPVPGWTWLDSLPTNGVYTALTFEAIPAAVLSGTIYDMQTNAIWGGGVAARDTNTWFTMDETDVNLCGEYALLLPDGDYWVETWGFSDLNYTQPDYLDGAYPDPVTVAGSDVGGIDIYLEQPGYIEGTVRGGGQPLADAQVTAFTITFENGWDTYWDWIDSTYTDTNGNYVLHVPEGADYRVLAESPGGSTWLEQWYDHTSQVTGSAPVAVTAGASTTGIDFDLQAGVVISGTVRGGGDPLSNIWVNAIYVWTNEYGGYEWGDDAAGTETDANGDYLMVVPPGSDYLVKVSPPSGSPWVEQYYDHSPDFNGFTPVHPTDDTPATGIDFDLELGATISGTVWGGGMPLENADVQAIRLEFDSEDNLSWSYEVAHTMTDADGHYMLVVPTGIVCAVSAEGPDTSPWLYQVYSNVTELAQGVHFIPDVASPITDIDFDLVEGAMIGGHVVEEGTGNPLSGVPITAFHFDDEGYFIQAFDAGTDGNGDYSMHVAEGSNYIVRAGGFGDWMDQLYYGTRDWSAAARLTAAVGAPLTDIDFSVTPGVTIRGYVHEPWWGGISTSVDIGSRSAAGDWEWRYTTWSDDGGNYECMMEAGSNHVVRVEAAGYPTVYYDRSLTLSNATVLSGPRGTTFFNIDFPLYADDIDYDNDKVSDAIEAYVMHSDPSDGEDYLEWLDVNFAGNKATLTWRSAVNTAYLVERTTNLTGSAVWTTLTPTPVVATGTNTVYVDSAPPSGSMYRIRVPY